MSKGRIVRGTVRSDSFEMDYFRFGSGPDLLVIIPGLSIRSVLLSAEAVADEYSIFERDYTVYLFDRRTDMPENYSTFEMAMDTSDAMKALGLYDVCLFGASQGGMIAMLIAAMRQELVKKLALASSASFTTKDAETVIHRWIDYAESGDGVGLFLNFGEMVYPRSLFDKYRDIFAEEGKKITREELSRFQKAAKGLIKFDARKEIRSIKCPVLIISSSDDAVIGAESVNALARQIGNGFQSELILYEGFGHAVYDTAPDCRERLFKFFRN